MAGLFEPIINYYLIYGPILILISIILTITYLFISNFAAIKSAYLCTSLKNVVTGNLKKCFSSHQGPTCKKSDIGFTHGWCNDTKNYGPLRGTRTGPYSVKCDDWIWQKEDCPPEECASKPKDWGWCADKDIHRAMRGQVCGPYSGKCENWIWDTKHCPTVKARYLIIKRIDKKEKPITILELKVYDSNRIVVKQQPRITQWPSSDKIGSLNTSANKEAYLQFDFKEDIDIGRIVISNSLNNNNLVGTSVVLRKDNNETALYRTITDISDKYDIQIGKVEHTSSKLSVQGKQQFNLIPVFSMFKAPATKRHLTKAQMKQMKKFEAYKAYLRRKAERRAKVLKYKQHKREQKIQAYKAYLRRKAERRAKVLKYRQHKREQKIQAYKAYLRRRAERRKKHGGQVESEAVSKLKLNRINANPGGPWSWALSENNNIYKCKNPCKGSWEKADGKFVQFDVDDKEIWAINKNNEIFKRQINGLGIWQKVPGNMKSITLGKTEIYGTGVNNDLYSCKQPCLGKWDLASKI